MGRFVLDSRREAVVIGIVVVGHDIPVLDRESLVLVHFVVVVYGHRRVLAVDEVKLDGVGDGFACRILGGEGRRGFRAVDRVRLALDLCDIAHGVALRAHEILRIAGEGHRDVQVVAVGILEDFLESDLERITFVEVLGNGSGNAVD